MEDNPILYERHEGLGIIQDQKVAIIGCGGIGSWIALYLGLAGVSQIDIYDSDDISENNLNRFPLDRNKVGLNKAEAMAIHIQGLRQGIEVTPRQNFEPDLHRDKLAGYSWVVVTTDSLKSRRMVYDEVVQAGKDSYRHIGYIECGADGHHATVTFSPATMATADEENPGYRSVPVFVGPCTMAAAIASYYVLLGHPQDYEKTYRVDWANYIDDMNPFVQLSTINEADEEIIVEESDGTIDSVDIPTVCSCYSSGVDGTRNHNEIAARITSEDTVFYSCANHLPLYQRAQDEHHTYDSIELLTREVRINEQAI